MKVQSFIFDYNGTPVEFQKNGNVMVNATQMAKLFDKQVNEFLSNQQTKNFVESCLKNGNSRYLNVETVEDVVASKQKTGTYMHRILALKFAAWLDADFELWVFRKIDEILTGKVNAIVENQQRRFDLLKELDSLKSEKYGIEHRMKEIVVELNNLDTDTFTQLDLFKAPDQMTLTQS